MTQNMTQADKYYETAFELESQGKTEEAISCFKKVIEIDPENGDAYYNLGIKLSEYSRVEEAIDCYGKAVHFNPNDSDAYYNLGLALNSLNKTDEAIQCFQKVIELNPDDPQAYNNLGIALNDQGSADQAISCYRKALEINPRHIQSYNNLGISLRDQGKSYEAIDCYRKVLEFNPDDPQAYNNMGIALKNLGKSAEAVSCYRKALEISPGFFQAYNNLGNALHDMGDTNEAISCYRKSIEIMPEYASTYYNMGNALKDQGNKDEAVENYLKSVKYDPGNPEPYKIIGNLLHEQGKFEKARAYYEKSLQLCPDPGLEVILSLLLPVICDSKTTIEKYRKRITENLVKLTNKGIRLEDPLKQVGIVSFLLAYHGLNDKEIMEKLAFFFLNACPSLGWNSPKLRKHANDEKIRIGMISTYLHGHTIGQLFFGIIKNLSRDKFHVNVFRFPGKKDPLSEAIDKAADEVITLPYELGPAREMIAEHALDILFYLDIGMDPMTYFLAFSRLAPVQCKRGHPVTSGIPNVDYFLSPGDAEIADADQHYSEQLIRLKTYGIYYYPPESPEQQPSRASFGLPEDAHLYVCPQSLFKFHPDFDFVFGSILRKDTKGLLILIEGQNTHWSRILMERFKRVFPDAADRVRFLPRMPHNDFMSLFILADAVLDTPSFTGGKTSLDCFAFGVPIVTLPGEFMRGRLTLAQYRQMDIMDCVAEDTHDFMNIALKLANDRVWKDQIKDKIKSRSHLLYEDMETVHELEHFFEKAVENAHN